MGNTSSTQLGSVSINISRNDFDRDKISLKDKEIKDKLLHRLSAVDYIDKDSIQITDIKNIEGLNITFDVTNDVEIEEYDYSAQVNGLLVEDDMSSLIEEICNDIGIYIDECEIEDFTLDNEEDIWFREEQKQLAEKEAYDDFEYDKWKERDY